MTISRERLRLFILMGLDALLIVTSFILALHVASQDFQEIHYRWYEYAWMIGVILAIKIFIFQRTGFYREMLRYVSMDFALKVIKTTVFGSLVSIIIIHVARPEVGLPVLVVDWMCSCILIGMSRFGFRYIKEGRYVKTWGRSTILYGAGEHGAAVARHLIVNDQLGYRIVGFVDDSVKKKGKKIQGISVLGTMKDLPAIIKEHAVEELVVAFANPDGDLLKGVFRTCREHGVRCRIVPGMTDVISGKEVVRSIDIADLMRRPQRSLNKDMISSFLKGRRILVTGGAGSIGSEICRQVLSYQPAALMVIDHSEYSLYRLDEELSSHPLKSVCAFSLVDIKCADLVDSAIAQFKPDIIFHAAAYKHVPILEQDVRQAVKNNVMGLQNLAFAAERHGVKRIVFISTDKAVRPTNVMGATKRIGELLMQYMNSRGAVKCTSVRFGNVLASSGSVIPKFIDQIKAGGPVTVTHPDVTRFFMLIPEAVELVLQAASIGCGGEVFVLDMGKPVRIVEMAEDLISLMGYVPYTGIPISYTGLRPGEKLHEELFLEEVEETTRFSDIKFGKVQPVDAKKFSRHLEALIELADSTVSNDHLKKTIHSIVPEYQVPVL